MSLGFVVAAIVLQTTLFGQGRIQPYGAAPSLVLLVVVASVRYLESDPALLLGFTSGLLMDLLGGSPLGLWAMVLTVVVYVTLRIRRRADAGPLVIAVGIFALALLGQSLFAVAGTLFGQRTLIDPNVVKLMILPAVYTAILAVAVVPLITVALGQRRNQGWAL